MCIFEGKLNFLLVIILLCGASAVGFKISTKFKSELILLQDFERFLSQFETNVNFSRRPIKHVIRELEESFRPKFCQILQSYQNQTLNSSRDQDKLNLLINDFFSHVGHSDVPTQLNVIKQTKASLHDIKKTLASNEKKSELSLKLGVMCGAGLFIIVL